MDNEVAKNTKLNTLKTKLNSLENKSINQINHINQYSTDKQSLPDTNGLVTTTV